MPPVAVWSPLMFSVAVSPVTCFSTLPPPRSGNRLATGRTHEMDLSLLGPSFSATCLPTAMVASRN